MEWRCTAKTFRDTFERLASTLRELQPYETPEIVCIAMEDVNPDYLQWMEETSTRDSVRCEAIRIPLLGPPAAGTAGRARRVAIRVDLRSCRGAAAESTAIIPGTRRLVRLGRQDLGDGPLWRLDGQLTDGGPALEFLELKGYCGREQLDSVLTTLGWPQHAVRFHLSQEGIFLDESEFRQRFITEGN